LTCKNLTYTVLAGT